MKYVLYGIAAVLAAIAGDTQAQTYPNKPIRLLTTFSAGGQADILARLVTDRVGASIGQPVVVEAKPGAGGNIAMEAAAKATPDGYTLVFCTPAVAINGTLYKNLTYDPLKDLVPISLAAWGPYAMYVSAKVPATNVTDLIRHIKANPGKLNYASVGVGSGTHLAMVLFTTAAGVEMTHIPYRGIQQAAPDLVSGQVQMTLNAIGPLDGFLQSGEIRLLANTGPTRLEAYPNTPTVSESLPGFSALGWYGFCGTRGTPPDVLQKLNAEIVKAVKEKAVWDRIVQMALHPAPQSLAEAQDFVTRDAEKWSRAVKTSGAVAE